MGSLISKSSNTLFSSETSSKSEVDRFYRESERLKSFEEWPIPYISPRKLAKAGLFFLNNSDIVRCAFCNIDLDHWMEGDDPMADHERWSPSCPFVTGKDDKNISIHSDIEEDDEADGPFESQAFWEYRFYEPYGNRLASYQNWPAILKPLVPRLCKSTLFFNNIGDQTKCYVCGEIVRDWKLTDEPLVRHPFCYSRRRMYSHFVDH